MLAWEEISDEEKSRLQASFDDNSTVKDLVRYENGFVMPRLFAEEVQERIYNFELREDDIWIVTYPKCGTTWTQELVWMLVNDVDIEAGKEPLIKRSVFLESKCVIDQKLIDELGDKLGDLADPVKYCQNLKKTKRRVIKTHLPFEFLPPQLLEKCKVIYVARNPKDCAVSFYHHNILISAHGFLGTFEEFMQYFKDGLHIFGSYWHHLKSGWERKNHKNLKFVWFEEMKADQKGIVEELIDFLKHPLSEEKIESLVDHVKFENMKKNPATNLFQSGDKQFIRKGQVGDWKNHFDEAGNEKFETWILENIKETDLGDAEHIKNIMEKN